MSKYNYLFARSFVTKFLPMDDVIIMSGALAGLLGAIIKKRKKKRTSWVSPYLKKRVSKGRYATDFNEMKCDEGIFVENFHMTPANLEYIYNRVEILLQPKKNTRPRDKILPKQKFVMVLEYLASGSLQQHVASTYRVSKQAFGHMIDDVCNAICVAMKDELPTLTTSDWIDVSNDFKAKWNFPNCLGAIANRHIKIKCPSVVGDKFLNNEGFHSIIMTSIVDASFKFLYIDVGGCGSESGFKYSKIGKKIAANKIQLPEHKIINSTKIPYFFIADDVFTERIMKPYSSCSLTPEERIFNDKVNVAMRVNENAFGIMATKWLCLTRNMFCGPQRAKKITATCSILHNYLLTNGRKTYCPPTYADYFDENGQLIDGDWRKMETQVFISISHDDYTDDRDGSNQIRNELNNFVRSSGNLISQENPLK